MLSGAAVVPYWHFFCLKGRSLKSLFSVFQLVRSAAFSKDGTLSLSAVDFPFPKDFQVGFGFQTTSSTGTLLNYNLQVGNTFNVAYVMGFNL